MEEARSAPGSGCAPFPRGAPCGRPRVRPTVVDRSDPQDKAGERACTAGGSFSTFQPDTSAHGTASLPEQTRRPRRDEYGGALHDGADQDTIECGAAARPRLAPARQSSRQPRPRYLESLAHKIPLSFLFGDGVLSIRAAPRCAWGSVPGGNGRTRYRTARASKRPLRSCAAPASQPWPPARPAPRSAWGSVPGCAIGTRCSPSPCRLGVRGAVPPRSERPCLEGLNP